MARYLLIVCLVLFSSFSLSQALTVKKEFQQSYDLNSGGELTIKNVNGKIQIDSWDKNKVELFAEIKVKAGNKRAAEKFMEKVEIKVKSIKDQLDISVEHPKKKDNESFFNLLFGNKKPNLSVQFFFKVPHECNLTASSVNGSVEVTGVSATADLQTVNGKINAENIQGAVDASTTNGSIYVEIAKTDNTENMKFKTVNGSVKVFLPKDICADLEVSTVNGSITTDFPVTVQGKWGPKKIQGEINGGGAELDISTVNGSVGLHTF